MQHMTGDKAARFLGISRRTLYRWADDGVIPRDWWAADLAPYVGTKRPKGPPRNRDSRRYTVYRHSFTEKRGNQRA